MAIPNRLREEDDWEPISPIPTNAANPTFVHPDPRLGKSTQQWPYNDSSGELEGYICRFEGTNGAGKKEIRPYRYGTLNGVKGWHWRGWGAGRPLYRLPEILADETAPILVVEGEKTADAAQEKFPNYVVTTPMHGAQSPQKTDWSPVKERAVFVWPDHDLPGRRFADRVAQLCRDAGAASVHVVDVPEGFPEKWDLAEDMPEGWDVQRFEELLAAKPPAAAAPDLELPDWDGSSAGPLEDEPAAPAPPPGAMSGANHASETGGGDAGSKAATDIECTENEAGAGGELSPEDVQFLSELADRSRIDYDRRREDAAKKLGVRIATLDAEVELRRKAMALEALDHAIAEENGDAGGRGPSQLDILIGLASEAALFHTPDSTGYADLEINGHRETWPIGARGFKRWLAWRFFQATAGAPNSEALRSALNLVEAKATFDAPETDVHIRVAEYGGKLYLDLADDAWRAVEIDKDGWRIVDKPPVRFRRAAGMLPLPEPVAGGSVKTLRTFLNVPSDDDFVLVVAWALAALRNKGPYPVLALSGEQGSAKSFFSAILRSLLDPNTAPLRALSREDRDLFIAATNGHVLTFDNVSGLPPWISDTLCRLATGGGFAVRQLYTDQDEVLFHATRPVILNGIEDFVTRPDLADRAIVLTLAEIPEDMYLPEKELWEAFEKARPQILGALLDAVSFGLRMLPKTRLEKLPRMADFALWATACEGTLWEDGTFRRAYAGNRDEAVDSVIEADPVAAAVRTVMLEQTVWTGTATDLLGALAKAVGERVAKSKTWPNSPRALSGRLRRAAAFLRKVGIEIDYTKEGRARTRVIRITGAQPSAPSAQSADERNPARDKGSKSAATRTLEPDADAKATSADTNSDPIVRKKANNNSDVDAADDADAKSREHSGGWRKLI